MYDPMSNMHRQMISDLNSITHQMQSLPQKWFDFFQQVMRGWINDLLKDAFNPDVIMQFVHSMGIDMSQLPGMVGKQPGFDPYQVLGLDKTTTEDEVKKRYRELVKRLHPDTAGVEGGGTAFMFQMVQAAYELIKRDRGWQ